jgi:TRAP-type uncharacterized transport system fused permease subunit
MIEFLNLPYTTIILAAIVPAFMHFFGVFMQVHFEAKRNGLRGLRPDGDARPQGGFPPRLADRHPARRADRRPDGRLHALHGGVLGHHALHRRRPPQPARPMSLGEVFDGLRDGREIRARAVARARSAS